MDPSTAQSTSEILSTATDLPVLSRPLNPTEQELLSQLDRLKYFLATAPSRWSNTTNNTNTSSALNQSAATHPALNRFLLPSGEYVSCVLWSGLYHITGTDIVRALVFRFEAFGRPVINMKKFEEGVFSDLRNLKPGTDACLEEPKSPFLDLLFKYQCIRTQKKQKVFYWFSVPHDRLFLDALERDLKREKMGFEATTVPRGEPAISFTYDSKRSLYEQFLSKNNSGNGDDDEESSVPPTPTSAVANYSGRNGTLSVVSPADILNRRAAQVQGLKKEEESVRAPPTSASTPFLSMFSLFEGSPTYKQRRKKTVAGPKRRSTLGLGSITGPGIAREPLMARPHPSIPHSQYPAQPQQQLTSYGLSMNPSVEQTNRPQWTSAPGGTTPSPPGTAMHPSLSSSVTPTPVNGVSASTDPAPNQMMSGSIVSTGNRKGYVCPLLTCRLLFRRVEHLKRHVRSHALTAGRRTIESSLGKFVCDRPGCQKRFTREENLKLHMGACAGGNGSLGFVPPIVNEDGEEVAHMDFEVDLCEVVVDEHARFEDDGASDVAPSPHPPSSAHGPRQLALYTDGMQQMAYAPPRSATSATSASEGGYYSAVAANGSNTPQFAHLVSTSAESSPYVETPEGGQNQWARLPSQQPHYQPKPQFSLALGAPGSAPPSSHGSNFHPPSRYDSPDVGLYPPQHLQQPLPNHPSSAPSHKATFDHGSLYPNYPHHPLHTGGMMGLSLRRHRSATPAMGGVRNGLDHVRAQMQSHSRPASSHSNYGSVVGNGHPFAYSVDNADGRGNYGGHGSDHSSPLSYGNVIQGEYDANGGSPLGSTGAGSPGSVAAMGMNVVQQPTESQVMQQYVDLDQYVENGDASYSTPGTTTATPANVYIGHPPASVSSYHEESPYLHSEPNAATSSYHSASPETTSPEEMEMYQFVGNGEPDHSNGHLQPQYHHQTISLVPHDQSMHLQQQQPHHLGAYAYT